LGRDGGTLDGPRIRKNSKCNPPEQGFPLAQESGEKRDACQGVSRFRTIRSYDRGSKHSACRAGSILGAGLRHLVALRRFFRRWL
jgi:hypothetical protein